MKKKAEDSYPRFSAAPPLKALTKPSATQARDSAKNFVFLCLVDVKQKQQK